MKISTNGKRNITLDFNAPKNFRIVQNGVEIPYLRTGKNSFRLSKKVDGDIEMEEVKEKAKRIKPFSLQSPQMTFISSNDVDRLNSAIEQISLVNPQDVAAINNAAEKIDSSQMYIAEKQQQLEATQTYIDQQQQRLNETALGIQALETDNSQRLDGAENAILNLAGEISNTQTMAVDGMNTALNKIEEQRILLQDEIDTKADKDELESLKKDFEEKSDQFSNVMSSYSGGFAYDTLPQNGEAGQILAKRTDRQGDYIWIDQTPVIVKSKTMPTASEKYKDEVYQYVGETGDYTHGYIYECQQNGTSYEWVRLDVQPNTAVWGQITGTLSDQTDLQDALNLKANKSYVDSQDNNLQQQIDAITAASDVTDIVGTYAQLQAYDTSTLPNNSIIKVLQDESRNNETTYYRWVITGGVGAWVLIGEEGPYYTKSETNTLLTAKQDTLVSGTNIKTVNGSSLLGSGNLSVAADINPYITNCITEIPQDIKLELNSNNRPVLKAGSKFYRPNGNGVFDLVSNTVDLAFNFTNTQTGKYFLCVTGNNSAGWAQVNLTGSGTSTEANNGFYYRTDDNKIYYQNNSSGNVYSFPLAIVTATNGVCVIDQVFNGFGYIGSTVFALPGVKGLIPNGRNADGTLKNTALSISNVITTTFSETQNNVDCVLQGSTFWARNQTIVKSASEIGTATGNFYIIDDNRFVYSNAGSLANQNRIVIGKISLSSGKVTSLTPKTAFHAVDYNDFKQADDNNVKLTGNQTISGTKTFTGSNPVILQNSSGKNTTLTLKDSTTTYGNSAVDLVQVTSNNCNQLYIHFQEGNKWCTNWAQSATTKDVTLSFSACAAVYAPTPATSDNSTQIATTAFVNNKFQVVSALPASPDSSTFYFITA